MMLQTVITLTLTFIVFTFASLLVAIQVASGQLTPRIIATVLLRDNAIRATVGLFIFTLLFATGTLGRLEAQAPFVLVGLAGILGFCSVATFLYLIDYAARLLRDGQVVQRGTPDELYERPANVYVASKIGSPHMNLMKAVVGPGAESFDTPVGPVRFDIGRNLNPVTGISATQFFVTLGQAF
jgi:hypothetical protein